MAASAALADTTLTLTASSINPSAAEETLKSRIESWRQAWAVRNVETYLAHYSVRFSPAKEIDRETWAANRRLVIGSRPDIQLTLSHLHLRRMNDQRWRVDFFAGPLTRQLCRKKLRTKSLQWALEGGQWFIVSERESL